MTLALTTGLFFGAASWIVHDELAHQQRCLNILATATDPRTPAPMRQNIFDEYTSEC